MAFILSLMLTFVSPVQACPDVDGLVDVNCDGKVVVLAFGDSITRGVRDNLFDITGQTIGYPGRMQRSYFPSIEIRNAGRPGEKSLEGLVRSASLFRGVSDLDYVLLLEGTNDYFDEARTTTASRDNLLGIFRNARSTSAYGLLGNLTDTKRSYQRYWVLTLNKAIDPHRHINFFNLGINNISFDGLHPTGTGYQAMALRAATILLAFSEARRPIDSDRDGLYDYEEARHSTGVNTSDSDGDGILDGAEVWSYRSNPRSLDSDGDGLSDNYEVFTLGSNPASALPGAPKITSVQALP